MKPKYIGLLYDKMNTAVSGRIMQDVIACLSVTSAFNRPLIVCSENDVDGLTKLLAPCGVPVEADIKKPSIFLSYKVGDSYADAPDNCMHEVRRNLQINKGGNLLNLEHNKNGWPLRMDERYSFSNTNRFYSHPNGFAPPDAALIMMWGPVKA